MHFVYIVAPYSYIIWYCMYRKSLCAYIDDMNGHSLILGAWCGSSGDQRLTERQAISRPGHRVRENPVTASSSVPL